MTSSPVWGMRGTLISSDIRIRQATREDASLIFDLILAMDRSNQAALLELSPPEYRSRVRLLLEFAAPAGREDVPDPYYGGVQGFDEVLDLVEEAAAGLLAEVRRSVS